MIGVLGAKLVPRPTLKLTPGPGGRQLRPGELAAARARDPQRTWGREEALDPTQPAYSAALPYGGERPAPYGFGGSAPSAPRARLTPRPQLTPRPPAAPPTLAQRLASQSEDPRFKQPPPAYQPPQPQASRAALATVADAAECGNLEGLMTGSVRSWHEDRGFGFISPDGVDEDDVFVHRSVLRDGGSLVAGSAVMFDLTYDTDRRRFQATLCVGAVPSPPAEAGGGKGGGKGGGFPEGLYRPSFVADPWEELYPPRTVVKVGAGEAPAAGAAAHPAVHLRAHLDGLVPPEEPAHAPGGWGAGRETSQEPASGTAEGEDLGTSPVKAAAVAGDAPGAAQEPKTPEPPKATSIYEFFEEDGDELLI